MAFGDRLFWGIMIFIGVNLFWLGLLAGTIPMWVGAIVGVLACLAMIKYGPRPKTDEPERGE